MNVAEDTFDAIILSVNSLVESYILDSEALFHCTLHYEIMENYISGDFGKVHLVDDEILTIMRKCDIQVKLPWKTWDLFLV